MGMQMHSGVGNRMGARPNRRRGRNKGLMSEINVTPFVDVMLVLLIIFMVAAPMMTTGVEVDLPGQPNTPMPKEEEPLVVTVRADGQIYLEKTALTLDALTPRLAAVTSRNREVPILVRGDTNVKYGSVLHVFGAIHAAGFTKVALETDPLGGQ